MINYEIIFFMFITDNRQKKNVAVESIGFTDVSVILILIVCWYQNLVADCKPSYWMHEHDRI